MKPLFVIAFTGHRPEKLPGGTANPNHPGRTLIKEKINSLLSQALAKYGETHQVAVIAGGAQGIDTDAAREALKLGIPYMIAIPFEGQSRRWETEAQERYQKMCRLANPEIAEALAINGERVRQGAVYISEGGYEYAKYGKRDRWMVDHCDALIAVYNGSPSGTGKTYDYAKSVGKRVLRINPKAFNAVPKVYSKRNPADIPEGAVYVGRPTKWGNPFEMGKHGNREEVVAKYKAWIINQPELMASLSELKGKDLVCWCAPEACHADVLLALANK